MLSILFDENVKPAAHWMSEQLGTSLLQLRAVPVEADGALVTYFANVKPATALSIWRSERTG